MARTRPLPFMEEQIVMTRTCVEIAGERPLTKLCDECPYSTDERCTLEDSKPYFVRLSYESK